ncbi:MAG: HEAT repeat domain-containing protein [Gemmataceae bacterium]|nr:HEAT repeat domain-containing protein [Gemmataceae bacterium]MDW8241949.1 HEAT repeat domain-containing protein [Thermogemmata sp.]
MASSSPRLPVSDDPLPELVAALQSGDAAQRLRAARDLGRLGPLASEALSDLMRATQDSDSRVREAAAAAIGGMGSVALPELTTLLRHADKYVRRQAVWALGRLGRAAQPALPALCTALKDSDPRTASGAAQALGNLGDAGTAAIPALTEAMCGTNIVLCRLAAKALSQIGLPALSTLIAHLYHHDPFVRGEAALAVGWLGPTAQAAVPHLARLLREAEWGNAAEANHPVLPLEQRRTPLRASDSDADSATPPQLTCESGEEALPPEYSSLVHAALSLGRLGRSARTALPVLHTAAERGFPALRRAARQAIEHILADCNDSA